MFPITLACPSTRVPHLGPPVSSGSSSSLLDTIFQRPPPSILLRCGTDAWARGRISLSPLRSASYLSTHATLRLRSPPPFLPAPRCRSQKTARKGGTRGPLKESPRQTSRVGTREGAEQSRAGRGKDDSGACEEGCADSLWKEGGWLGPGPGLVLRRASQESR